MTMIRRPGLCSGQLARQAMQQWAVTGMMSTTALTMLATHSAGLCDALLLVAQADVFVPTASMPMCTHSDKVNCTAAKFQADVLAEHLRSLFAS
jgi:hypothetical protein